MAERGGQPGNTNSAKNRPFEQALRRAIARRAEGFEGGLNLLADKVIDAAMDGQQWAMQEISNRLDGKPHQAIQVSGEGEGGAILIIRRQITDSNASGSS
jgi:hypothetical protein